MNAARHDGISAMNWFNRKIDPKRPYGVFGVRTVPLPDPKRNQRELILRKEGQALVESALAMRDSEIPNNFPMEGRDLVEFCGDEHYVPHFCGGFEKNGRVLLVPAHVLVEREDAINSRRI